MMGPIARGTIRTSGVLGLRLLVQAGTLLLVARLLGPRDYGAFAGVSSLALILGTLSTFGLHLVLLGEISRDPARREYMLARSIPATLVCSTLLLAIFLGICLTGLREADLPFRVLFAIGATEILLQPLLSLPACEMLARGNVARSQLLATLPLAFRLIAAAGIALFAPTDALTMYGYAYPAASALALMNVFLVVPESYPRFRQWRWPNAAEWRKAAGYAASNITASGPAELDKTVATKLLPLAESGIYAAGQRVIGAATIPLIAMMLSAFPRLFRESQYDAERTARLPRWIFAVTAAYSLIFSCTIWFCAPAISRLFGHKYAEIEIMLRWLVLAVPGMALRLAAGGLLLTMGKPWMRVSFELSGLGILVVTSLTLTTRFGGIGMPLALACSETVMAVVGIVLVALARNPSHP